MRNAIWRIAKHVPVVVAFEDCLYGPAVVQGRSMQPTFCPDGVLRREVVLAEKWSIKLYRFHRGDVVLLRCRIILTTLAHAVLQADLLRH